MLTTLAFLSVAVAALGQLRPVTVDDEMTFRSIVDVKIAPNGERVAYVVSKPSLTKNEHEAALFVVSAAGGVPTRLGEALRIFNTPLPAPRLRWSPDGTMLSLLAFAGERPQVFAIPLSGGAPRALTDADEGVSGFEWSPDEKSIAYLARDPMSAEEARRREDKSFVIHVDAPERPTRISVKPIEGGAARVVTPPSHYVDSFSWSPDGRQIAYSAAVPVGDSRPRLSEPRAIVDRAGMNTKPQSSPDGRLIAFISSNGLTDIMATRSLDVVPAQGGEGSHSVEAAFSPRARRRDSRKIPRPAKRG